jgi:hypothetical protein
MITNGLGVVVGVAVFAAVLVRLSVRRADRTAAP